MELVIKQYINNIWDLWEKIHSNEKYMESYPGRPLIPRFHPDRKDTKYRQDVYHHLFWKMLGKCSMKIIIHTAYKKFLFVRNPWDRLVSYCEYGRQTG